MPSLRGSCSIMCRAALSIPVRRNPAHLINDNVVSKEIRLLIVSSATDSSVDCPFSSHTCPDEQCVSVNY